MTLRKSNNAAHKKKQIAGLREQQRQLEDAFEDGDSDLIKIDHL